MCIVEVLENAEFFGHFLISFIMSLTNRSERDYNNIEYEIKKYVYLEIIEFLPSDIKVSLSVTPK